MKIMKKANRPSGVLARKLYLTAYLQIALQGLFPLMATITPSHAAEVELPALPSDPLSDESSAERQTAQWLTQASTIVASEQQGEAAKQWASSQASSALSDSAEHWLGGYGHARVSLGVDQRFHFAGSSADLLLPLSDTPDLLTFAQFGVHDKDDYTTANLGVGQRWFSEQNMVGYNLFFDQELRNNHSRLGGGVEFWRDYLKLSANGYLALTGWKESETLTDYLERPASGYDLRSEGYLSAWPQLGGKLAWEQYFGDEVALFGREQRQRDPYAVTAGLNYTPVPLVTAGVDYKQGKDGANETLFNLQFNYQFGTPWSEQISGDAVQQRRTLSGSRLDFVERNNNMVMRYKKMEVIKLALPARMEGQAGSQQVLTASVEAKYGLARLQWRSEALTAAGGSIKALSPTQYQVTLPTTAGTYSVQAVAYDQRGNASQPSSLTVISQEKTPVVGKYHFSLTPANAQAYNSGNDPIEWTLAVNDESGTSLSGYQAKWQLVEGKGKLQRTSSVLDPDGKTQNSLTSTDVGKVKLQVTLWDSEGQQQVGEQSAEGVADFVAPNAPTLSVQAEKVYQRPDGQFAIDWTVNAHDSSSRQNGKAGGDGLAGYTLQWSSDAGTFAQAQTQTDRQGNSRNTVVSGSSQDVTVTVSLLDAGGNALVEEKDDSAQFVGTYQLVLTPASTEAPMGKSITWDVAAKDSAGQALGDGYTVKWEVVSGQGTFGTLNETPLNAEGKASNTLSSAVAGTVGVKASLVNGNGEVVSEQQGATVSFVDTSDIKLTLTPSTIVASVEGDYPVEWVVDVSGLAGRAAEDYHVLWSTTLGKMLETDTPVIDGKAKSTLISGDKGNAGVTVKLVDKGGQEVSQFTNNDVKFVKYDLKAKLKGLWLESDQGGVGGNVSMDSGDGHDQPLEGYRVHMELIPKGGMDITFKSTNGLVVDVTTLSGGYENIPAQLIHAENAGAFTLKTTLYDHNEVLVASTSEDGQIKTMVNKVELTSSQPTLKEDGSDTLTLTTRIITNVTESEEPEVNIAAPYVTWVFQEDVPTNTGGAVTAPETCRNRLSDDVISLENNFYVLTLSCKLIGQKAGKTDLEAKWKLINHVGEITKTITVDVLPVDTGDIKLTLTPSTTVASVEGDYPVEWVVDVSGLAGRAAEDYHVLWSTTLGKMLETDTPVIDGKAKSTLISSDKGNVGVTVKLVDKGGQEVSQFTNNDVKFVKYSQKTNFKELWLEFGRGSVNGSVMIDDGSGSELSAEGYRVHMELIPKGDMEIGFGSVGEDGSAIDLISNASGNIPPQFIKAQRVGEFTLKTTVYDRNEVLVASMSKAGEIKRFVTKVELTSSPPQPTLKEDGSDMLMLTSRMIFTVSLEELEEINITRVRGEWQTGNGLKQAHDDDHNCAGFMFYNPTEESGFAVLTTKCTLSGTKAGKSYVTFKSAVDSLAVDQYEHMRKRLDIDVLPVDTNDIKQISE
ncbi:Gamma-intimin [Serratia quinivorans]|uniref:inverse autotransporter beta domain-containing protein n=1 Tax=Serratia quinivorans TaxID=137545 RepID=UPI002179494E|nr:inverse autotransporter beta domain-containing protein [Serratia quinivorans]CAI1902395.1 Gamma-intimin [Serratia quinivorans]